MQLTLMGSESITLAAMGGIDFQKPIPHTTIMCGCQKEEWKSVLGSFLRAEVCKYSINPSADSESRPDCQAKEKQIKTALKHLTHLSIPTSPFFNSFNVLTITSSLPPSQQSLKTMCGPTLLQLQRQQPMRHLNGNIAMFIAMSIHLILRALHQRENKAEMHQ